MKEKKGTLDERVSTPAQHETSGMPAVLPPSDSPSSTSSLSSSQLLPPSSIPPSSSALTLFHTMFKLVEARNS